MNNKYVTPVTDNTFFVSDLHFNHDREFIYGSRGFKSCEEANKTLIANWNKTVSKDDTVYILGDFFLGSNIEYVKSTLAKLNGKFHLIIGNHDTPSKMEIYESIGIKPIWADMVEYKGRQFYLSHYPTLTADLNSNPKTAVFNLFGHTHSPKKFYEERPYMYNVAVDAHDNRPISIKEIYEDIDNEIKKCLTFLV